VDRKVLREIPADHPVLKVLQAAMGLKVHRDRRVKSASKAWIRRSVERAATAMESRRWIWWWMPLSTKRRCRVWLTSWMN
jgi:hypothetical protein